LFEVELEIYLHIDHHHQQPPPSTIHTPYINGLLRETHRIRHHQGRHEQNGQQMGDRGSRPPQRGEQGGLGQCTGEVAPAPGKFKFIYASSLFTTIIFQFKVNKALQPYIVSGVYQLAEFLVLVFSTSKGRAPLSKAKAKLAKYEDWKATQETAGPSKGPSKNIVRGEAKASVARKGKEKARGVSGAPKEGDQGEGSSKVKVTKAVKGGSSSKAKASVVDKREGSGGGKKVAGEGRTKVQATEATSPRGEVGKGEKERKKSAGQSDTMEATGVKTVVPVEISQQPKGLLHREGGRMTMSNTGKRASAAKSSSRAKKVKSAEFVHSDVEAVEVDKKGKWKAAAKAEELVKAVGQVEAEEGDRDEGEGDEDTDGDGDEDDDNNNKDNKRARKSGSKAPLEIVKNRAVAKAKAEKPPANYVAGDDRDRCGQCEKARVTCHWLIGALSKPAVRACWACKSVKRGCTRNFRNPRPTAVNLSTPLGSLVERIAPPASESAGVPRPGILGEAAALPTTLGELLVDLLGEVRAMREENQHQDEDEVENAKGIPARLKGYVKKYLYNLLRLLQPFAKRLAVAGLGDYENKQYTTGPKLGFAPPRAQ
jgi:hypothetical protein